MDRRPTARRGGITVNPTRDPVTGYPALEIGSNLVILRKETKVSDLQDIQEEHVECVLTPADRGMLS